MDHLKEYFLCMECQNKEFKRINSFSLQFHSVNFSDDRIYDMLTDEKYQCTKCGTTFTKDEIEEGLLKIKQTFKIKSG